MTPASTPQDLGLPHRSPFVFLQSVTQLNPGHSARAIQRFPASDPVFQGHFPGEPVVPGVLIAEAIAQLAGIIAASGEQNARFYLAAIRQMKFPAAAFPEEEILIEATLLPGMAGLVLAEGTAHVGNRLVAAGSVVLASKIHANE